MNFYLKASHNGNKEKPKVALTFDDAPNRETTALLLKKLDKHQINATFFCIGEKIEINTKILKKIFEKGHLIGNHSWSHSPWFDFYLPGKMIREINKADSLINSVHATPAKLFRPPFGVTNPFLSRALKKTQHMVIGWSLRSFDTSSSKKKVLDRIDKHVKNGDIILLHDINQTVDSIEEIIILINSKGMQIVGLEELLNLKLQE